MKPYSNNQIQDKNQMVKVIEQIHVACHQLCKQSLGRYLPVAGNLGIFCHYEEEYVFLKELQANLTDASKSVYEKYFLLHTPIVIPKKDDIPEATYRYLYIRKPDSDKPQVGDVDFYLEPKKYLELKHLLKTEHKIHGARILPNRPDLDLIELYDSEIDALAYIGDKNF